MTRPGEGPGGRPSPVEPALVEPPPATAGRWSVYRRHGAAADLHHRPWPSPPLPSVWFLTVDRPALVLGSTQAEVSAAIDVVRRRSGGGAVLVEPESPLWVDIMLPAGDRLWAADVGRAFLWLGQAWAAALAAAGVDGVTVHRGPPSRTALARAVCFAGLGPGEVAVDGRKVVGISQRRTRSAALFQCAALLRWDPDAIAALVGVPPAELAERAAAVPVDGRRLEQALLSVLADL